MRLPFVRLALSALAVTWIASPARGQLTSGNATFTQLAYPGQESEPLYFSEFRPEGASTTNHLSAQWLFYRVAGDTKERAFGGYTKSDGGQLTLTNTVAPSGDAMTYAFTEQASGGATRFTADWTIQLSDGQAAGEATLSHSVTITNPTAAPLTISLFHFLDYDLTGEFDGHSATADLSGMTITRGSATGTYTPLTAATHYQSDAYGTIDTTLNDGGISILSDGDSTFTNGDWIGAYQWDLVIQPGQSFTVEFEMGVSPVPEPGLVLTLAACGLGLAGLARRARPVARG
ncbi:MAG TPA: hypothetical protein VM533_16780 [Fimbriiglobus sp.]|jgi:hypothetical protein|nr:hypothetical protein [Fimbriiglobus sp.]